MNFPFLCSTVLVIFFLTCGVDAQTTTDDQELAKLNSELARAYAQEKYDDALALSSRIVELVTQRYPKTDLNLARALKNHGFIENAKGDTKRAGGTLDDAAEIYKKHPNLNKADGSSFAGLLEALATIKMASSFTSGASYLEQALKWREKSNGPEAAETGAALARLANIKFWTRDYKAASEMYERALLIVAKTTKNLADDSLSIVRERTRCAFRKAKIEDGFASVQAQYDEIVRQRPDAANGSKIVTGGVLNGKATYLAKPSYPTEAKQKRVSGSVSIHVLINESGEVITACSVSGSPYLTESAEIAALQSKYTPTLLAGQPVKVSGVITYNFVP